jgi:hypothetical protein
VHAWWPGHSLGRGLARAAAGDPAAAVRALSAAARRPVRALRGAGRRGRQWLFDEIAGAELKRGFRSTFYFASTPCFARNGHRLDVDYDVAHPAFRPVFHRLHEDGFEIGLHTGYNARASAGAIRAEVRALEACAGVDVLGARHHYWHMERPFWPTLRKHGEAGLRYDSSMSFNEAPGFRLGVALPFHPWSPDVEAPVAVLQIPNMAMDGGYFYHYNAHVAGAVEHFQGLVNTLKRYEGVASLDWHDRAAYPAAPAYREWGRAYLEIIDLLAADPEVEVTTAAEVYRRALRPPGVPAPSALVNG